VDPTEPVLTPRAALGALGAVLARPGLWATALRQAGRMRRRDWWRHAPFLPLPDRDYLRFRLLTQYGATAPVVADDVVVYLRWCRARDR
jgi:hypothetical protein